MPGAPPVTAGPLLVGLAQAIARPRPAVSGRDLGEVGQPDVERVQAGGLSQLVHGALQGPQPRALDRRPHRRGHVQADPLDQLPQPQGRHGVQRLAGLGGGLDVGVGQGRVVDDLVLEAEQYAVGGRAEPDRLLHPRLVAHVAELVRAPQVQLDRAACHPGRGGREDFVRPDVALGAEPAAGVRRHHVHVRGVDAERDAHHADDGRARLHRVPQGEPAAVPARDRARRLHRVVVPRGLQVGLLDGDRRGGQGRVDVAPDLIGAHRGLAAAMPDQHRRLALAVDDHGGPACLGCLDRLGQDDGDRLALVPDPVVGERHHADRGWRRQLGEAGQVGGCQHGRDAGQDQRRRRVHAAQSPGRHGRADEDRVQHPVGPVVGGVAGGPGQLQRSLYSYLARAGGPGGGHDAPPAVSRARTAAFLAIVTLNPFCGRGAASAIARSMTGVSASRVSGVPGSSASAASSRQGR